MSASSRRFRRRTPPAHARARRASKRAVRLGSLAVLVVASVAAFLLLTGRRPFASALTRSPGGRGASAGAAGARGRSGGARHKSPPLARPTAARPLGLLEIGDSLGEDLGFGLQAVLGHDPRIQLHTKAVGNTGLANVAYYNWPATLEAELRAYHPGLVVVFLGGNDAQGFDVGSRPAFFGTAFWRTAYTARVRRMMAEATATGAHVLWVGMPPMAPSTSLTPAMAKLDAIYATVAKSFPLVRYESTWRLFESAAGQFAMALPDGSGQLVTVRDPDGVHLTSAGGVRVAEAVVGAVQRDWRVRL